MKLCKVEGSVVGAVHHKVYDGQKLLIVTPVDGGDSFLAVDRVQAGVGDTVLVNQEGNGARQVFGLSPRDPLPIRSVIVGVVDDATEPK